MPSSLFSITRIALVCAAFVGAGAGCAHRADEAGRPGARATQAALAPRAWTSSGPLVHPVADARHPIVSVKDPTVVYHNGKWHVFATTADTNGAWSMAYFSFRSWEAAPQAKPFYLDQNPNLAGYNCAPQVF
ncbi:MAG TPA: non-reducing end alpha-L-arabinofuranosidase family hydrolase, partial [Opitutaceae bacterium]